MIEGSIEFSKTRVRGLLLFSSKREASTLFKVFFSEAENLAGAGVAGGDGLLLSRVNKCIPTYVVERKGFVIVYGFARDRQRGRVKMYR